MGDERPIRVLIADDHPLTRTAVRSSLEANGFAICAEAADAPSAIDAARQHRPDVVLLDIRMPGDGIEAAAAISSSVPGSAIIMLTVSRDDDDLFAALQAGAVGYLLKDTDPDRLPLALRGVLAGEAALPRGLMARVIGEFKRRERAPRPSSIAGRDVDLSRREWEVLEAMSNGLGTGEIAAQLYISSATVRSHVAAILHKLKVPDRASAVRILQDTERDN